MHHSLLACVLVSVISNDSIAHRCVCKIKCLMSFGTCILHQPTANISSATP